MLSKILHIFTSFFKSYNIKMNMIPYIVYKHLYSMPINSIINTCGVFSALVCAWKSFMRKFFKMLLEICSENIKKFMLVINKTKI
jgi:hypothetical protein